MRVFVGLVWIMFLAVSVINCEGVTTLETDKEKLSYSIGLDIGKNFREQSIEIDQKAFVKGMEDALKENAPMLTEEEIKEIRADFQKAMMEKQANRMKELAEDNKKKGEAFMAANAEKEGVVTLPSGLQYKVLKEGSGKSPKPEDSVSVHYKGTLISGSEFDSSYKRGQSVTFTVKGVIPGWTEALQLMKEGAKWRLFIPSKLAYGERGAGRSIGPNETLIFDVELLEVVPAN